MRHLAFGMVIVLVLLEHLCFWTPGLLRLNPGEQLLGVCAFGILGILFAALAALRDSTECGVRVPAHNN